MSTHVNLVEFKAPAAWASYLINGDASGITEDERKRADEYTRGLDVIDCEDEAHFTWSFDLYGGECAGGEVLRYSAIDERRRAA